MTMKICRTSRPFTGVRLSSSRIAFAALLWSVIPLAMGGPALSVPLASTATDLWNAPATATSGTLYPGTGVGGMFGGNSGGAEPGNTVFGDNYAKGTLHTVDWQTAAPVTILSFALFARHDGPFPTRDANFRGFDRFELFAFIDGSYQSIFSYDAPALRYGNNVAPPNSILGDRFELGSAQSCGKPACRHLGQVPRHVPAVWPRKWSRVGSENCRARWFWELF